VGTDQERARQCTGLPEHQPVDGLVVGSSKRSRWTVRRVKYAVAPDDRRGEEEQADRQHRDVEFGVPMRNRSAAPAQPRTKPRTPATTSGPGPVGVIVPCGSSGSSLRSGLLLTR